MTRCGLCYDLEKEEDDVRLAFDFPPTQLLRSAKAQKCISCAFILEGVLRFEDESWSFDKDVTRAYVYGLGIENDSLSMELYFNDERPKLVLEFFHRDKWYQTSESHKLFHSTLYSSQVPAPSMRSVSGGTVAQPFSRLS
jgi:hypothetical protein